MLSMYLLLICMMCGFIYINEMAEISYGFLYKLRVTETKNFYKNLYLDEEELKIAHLIR